MGASWSKIDHKYEVFPGFNMNSTNDTRLRENGFPGFIATKLGHSMIECAFPRDGVTVCRHNGGCGCIFPPVFEGCAAIGKIARCDQPSLTDWCDTPGASEVCAYRGNQTSQMLDKFKESGGGDEGRPFRTFGYKEALVDKEKWAGALPGVLWAFVIPYDCPPISSCYKSWSFWYPDFVKRYGRKPIVGFNATNYESPC